MYKTSTSWSVWEGEHLGVSTFLPNYIKCTQGWIFYLFGFFFRTNPYGALDFWTWKITTSFANTKGTKPSSIQRRCWAHPCLYSCCCPASTFVQTPLGRGGPKELRSLLKTVGPAWSWGSWKLFLMFPGAVSPYIHHGLPPARGIYVWIFKGRVHI